MGQRLEPGHVVQVALTVLRLEGLDAAEGSQVPQLQNSRRVRRDELVRALDGVAVH